MSEENVQAEQGNTESVEQVEQVEAEIQDKLYPGQDKEVEKSEEPKEEPSKEEEAKPEEPKKEVPEKYDLKIPKGSHLEKSALDRIAEYAKEQGLSNDEAQWLLTRESEAVNSYVERATEMNQKASTEWAEAAKNDKEFGGEKFEQSVSLARNALNRFASEDLVKALQETGYGNHPELIRAFYRVGRAMANDKFVVPREHSSGNQKKTMEEIFYSNKE